jgi:hypothetical protein
MARLTERLLAYGRQQVDYTSPVTPAGRPMSHRIVRREPFADLAADLAADPAKWQAGRPVERRRRQRRLRPGQCEPLKIRQAFSAPWCRVDVLFQAQLPA